MRISKRPKKLQDLVPNMDKVNKTHTVDSTATNGW
jgi:hypothetical protein